MNVSISEFALIHAFTKKNCFINLIGIRSFENLRSLKKIISMKASDVNDIKNIADKYVISKSIIK